MATKIFVFWKLVADPPSPWTRLTRTNKYIRLASDTANHVVETGAATHTPSPTAAIGNNPNYRVWMSGGSQGMNQHGHPSPSPWTSIQANNNNPPYYGLDIIYMDLTTWEATERRFPAGAVLVSNGALVESSELARFSVADGYYIMNATPASTGGSTTPQSHRCQGTTGASGASGSTHCSSGSYGEEPQSHTHSIDLTSGAVFGEPRHLITRLYEALIQTSKAQQETVIFVDGAVGSNWEILTGWAGANLKAGNSDPALAGSDTHSQSISGNTSDWTGTNNRNSDYQNGSALVYPPHNHPVSASWTDNHVPLSIQLIPARLKTTLLRNSPSSQCVMC